MFGDPDLEFGRDGGSYDSNADSASSYNINSSASFGFSIHDAIRELALEEDGDPRTFLHKSTALLSNAPSSSTTPTPTPLLPHHVSDSIASTPVDLKTITRTSTKSIFPGCLTCARHLAFLLLVNFFVSRVRLLYLT